MLTLFCDDACPYAHRVEALLQLLQLPATVHRVAYGQKHAELEDWFVSARIPALVHDELPLFESLVMMEYVAETFDWPVALPRAPGQRALHRLAARRIDEVILVAVFGELRGHCPSSRSELDLADLDATLARCGEPRLCMLALVAGSAGVLLESFRDQTTFGRRVARYPALMAWLRFGERLDCVRNTARAVDLCDEPAAITA